MPPALMRNGFAAIIFYMVAAFPASAEDASYKLTSGLYQYSGADSQNGQALDINVRRSSHMGNLWVGHFVSWAQDLTQTRIGWDHTYPMGPVRLIPSLQLATAGAWNGSFSVETGERWFVGTGLGRTNLRDSVSLNFDPNDSQSLSGGYRWHETESVSFLLVRDNRLNPDQQHLHLIYRTPLPDAHRLTVDLLLKSGLVAGDNIERTGLSVAYDGPQWFVRLTYDPKANFTPQDLWRLALGTRF